MITLHHCYQSRSDRVLWLLHEMGLEFALEVYPFGTALRSEAFTKVHELGRVPAIEIDGRSHFESGAILEILTERGGGHPLGRGADHVERADFLVWLHFAESISAHVQNLTQHHIMLFEDHMRSPTVMKLEAKRLAKCFGVVENALAGADQEYLLPSGFSAADIALGQAIYLGQRFARIEGFPWLSAWMKTLTARPAFQKTLPPADAELIYKRDFYEAPNG